MKFVEYMEMVDKGEFPDDPRVVLEEPFKNDAGEIWNIVESRGMTSATFIKSVAGSVRSNHKHKQDWHFIYVVSGLMYYYEKQHPTMPENLDDHVVETPLHRYRVGAGRMIFTRPGVEHTTFFPVDTLVVTLNHQSRSHVNHESDVVRTQPLVVKSPELCTAVMSGVKCCLPREELLVPGSLTPHSEPHESVVGHKFTFQGIVMP